MALWNELPDRREELLELEAGREENARDQGIEPYVGTYSYISIVLVDSYLFPLLDAPAVDAEGLRDCARALELMLSTESSFIEDAVAIRAIRDMLLYPDRWRRFRAFAGPLFKKQVVEESQYHWFEDEPVIYEKCRELRQRSPVSLSSETMPVVAGGLETIARGSRTGPSDVVVRP